MSKLIVNCETGEVIERELNAEELAQQEIDEANIAAAKAIADAEAETKAQAKAAAEAKLAALGLTTDDLWALGL
jgi:hypothetical protein